CRSTRASRGQSSGSASIWSTPPTSSATGCRRKPTSSLLLPKAPSCGADFQVDGSARRPSEMTGRPTGTDRRRTDVVAIFGPTASGKTAVAEAVADRIGGEVVSADSMQAYRGLPILTAQPARPTRLVGIWPLSHEGSVAEYAELAHTEIDELLAAG